MKTYFLLIIITFWGLNSYGQPLSGLHPDSTEQVLTYIEGRHRALDRLQAPLRAHIQEAADLGQWDLIQKWENLLHPPPAYLRWITLRRLWKTHRYLDAERLFQSYLEDSISDMDGIKIELWKARIAMRAWKLDDAKAIYLELLTEDSTSHLALTGLGKIEIFEKNYLKALALAEQILEDNQASTSVRADALVLAAEAHFWLRREKEAEKLLQRALRVDPLHAEARFAYGYAIWRRRKASQLPQMAAQWEIALRVDPLHYKTHWHWGNGHTHLTFENYKDLDEFEIRKKLEAAEAQIARGHARKGLQLVKNIQLAYPSSVIPDLYRASFYYSLSQGAPSTYLHAAERCFLDILKRKVHYGPAHNGLAAVIKKRQFLALAAYDSLEKAIAGTELLESGHFIRVFPDLANYPGERVSKMVWSQLHSTTAYLPMLSRLRRTFAIPPLHEDLSIAMGSPGFRGSTTFDNRQWMDIRGVGSGATGIEYVERAAHLERNVTLHEYVHLFHQLLFTDEEKREVRRRYFAAIRDSLVLDYYAANNESEYLAQAIPAYFSEQKVHPLNHKAANTRMDLLKKDPILYAWIDSRSQKQEAYLRGDSSALAKNWAEAYLYLASMERKKGQDSMTKVFLDSALSWAPDYVPAWVQKIDYTLDHEGFRAASLLLAQIAGRFPDRPDLKQMEAKMWEAQFERGKISREKAIREIGRAYEAALQLEDDYMLQADLNQRLRDFYRSFGLWEEGIQLAETYILDGPEESTYLRDAKNLNRLYLAEILGRMGYYRKSSRLFDRLIEERPQNYYFRTVYADVLLQLGLYGRVLELIGPSQQLLSSAGNPSTEFQQQLALAYLGLGDTVELQNSYRDLLPMQEKMERGKWRQLRLDMELSGLSVLSQKLSKLEIPREPEQLSEYHYLQAKIALEVDQVEVAIDHFQQSLEALPYHMEVRLDYLRLLEALEEKEKARVLVREGLYLPLPPGPFYLRIIDKYVEKTENKENHR